MRLLRLARAGGLALLLAAAGCPDGGGPPPGGGGRFTVHLSDPGPDPAATVAAVVSLTGYDPRIAGALVERASPSLPVPIRTGLPEAEARAAAEALGAAGARAVVAERPAAPD